MSFQRDAGRVTASLRAIERATERVRTAAINREPPPVEALGDLLDALGRCQRLAREIFALNEWLLVQVHRNKKKS